MTEKLGLSKLVERIFGGRPPVGSTPADVVFAENKWRLLRYRARKDGLRFSTPVLLVPSLINRHYVLDLLPGRSFAEYLVNEGHDVFIIDWGTPGDEDRFLTFDDICDRYLGRAIRRAARLAKQPQVHLLGYCLGGTLTAIYAAARPEKIATLTALAAPIRFIDDGMLSKWMRNPTFNVRAIADAFGNVPWPMMQSSFHLLKPTLNLNKGVKVLERAWDDEFLDGFFAIETWGNDNVSFPGQAYTRYIEELYQDDALIDDRFRLSGRPAHLRNITCPTMVVTFGHDYIVPWQSAAILTERVGGPVEHVAMPGGHVGAVVSKKAAHVLWPKLSSFWAEHAAATDGASRPLGVVGVSH